MILSTKPLRLTCRRNRLMFPGMEEGLDWLVFVQTVLSEAGFDGRSSLHSFISNWYSPESPLDPSLREKVANEPIIPEAKCQQRRSVRKLAFDCVNSALVEVTGGCGSSWSLMDRAHVEVRNGFESLTLSMMMDRVWAQMKEWFSDGKSGIENSGLEMHCLGKDTELKLLGELVAEAVKDLTGRS